LASPKLSYSAYVPCFNDAKTIDASLRSLQFQTHSPSQLFLVDDGSTDESTCIAERLGVDVLSLGLNRGRGAARATSIENAQHEFVACCDATNYLPPDYVARALGWFVDPQVAAVCGPISQECANALADRWRGRHLFKITATMAVQHQALLSTGGCVLRRSAVLEVGNFNSRLRHSEDADLGRRLLDAGFHVIFDPSLYVYAGVSNTIPEVLERYWRWNGGEAESISIIGYAKQIWYSLRFMVPLDLRDEDYASAFISIICPHYQFWKSWWRQRAHRVQS